MKICTYFNKGSRFPQMILEGCNNHKSIRLFANTPVRYFDKIIRKPFYDIIYAARHSDYIFLSNLDHLDLNDKQTLEFINILHTENLIRKTVIIDFKDSCVVDYGLLKHCHTYFKRSVVDKCRNLIPEYSHPKLFPLDFCVLDCYLENYKYNKSKEYDVGYLFNDISIMYDDRRKFVKSILKESKWNEYKTIFESVSNDNIYGRQGIWIPKNQNNWFNVYLRQLRNTKCIFTTSPNNHEGDSRTWEAMSSGALCFLNRQYIPKIKPLETPFFFDHNRESIEKHIDICKHLLNDSEDLTKLSKKCYNEVIKNHRSIDRIKYILNVLNRKINKKDLSC